jgi:hypothetical protein
VLWPASKRTLGARYGNNSPIRRCPTAVKNCSLEDETVTKPKRSRPFIRLVTGAIVAFQSLSATAASASSAAALNVDETGHIVVMEYESLYMDRKLKSAWAACLFIRF